MLRLAGRRLDRLDIAEQNRKGGADADLGGERQFAVHEHGELVADGQAEPRAVAVVLVGELDERQENAGDVLLRDALARVRDRQRQRAVLPADANRHRSAIRVFVRVRQQVEEDLADALRVDADPGHLPALCLEFKRLARPGDLAGGDDLAHERWHVGRLLDDLQLAALQFREVEDVVHEAREHLAARPDGGDAAGALGLVGQALLKQFREPDDGVERRADVVRHG